MADTKIKAALSIARFLVGVVFGYIIYYLLDSFGSFAMFEYGWLYSIICGVIVALIVIYLISKMKGGGD